MQTKNKETKTIKRKRVSLNNRVINTKRNQIKSTPRNRRKKRKSIANVNFLTSNSIKPLSAIRINSIFKDGLFQDGDIIEIIEDIYPTMKEDISIFLPTQSFDENTHPADFLSWMVNCYEDMHPNTNWGIYSYGKFRIERVYNYEHSEDGQSASLDFLPKLKREDKKLYELMVSILSHMYSELGIPFYFDGDDLFYAIETAKENFSELKDELKNQHLNKENKKRLRKDIKMCKEYVREYEGGAVKDVENDIKGLTFKILSLKQIKNRLIKYDESCYTKFVAEALELFDYNVKFHQFLHYVDEEIEEGRPVTPHEYASIGWNFDDDNPIANNINMIHECNWNEYGSIPFRHLQIDNNDDEASMFPHQYLHVLNLLCLASQEYT